MTKDQYRAAYREARLVAKFILDCQQERGIPVESLMESLKLCPGFTFLRLRGDYLQPYGIEYRWPHELLMIHLREPVRLPA